MAWKPLTANSQLVVRGGYGIYYSRTSGNNVLQLLLEPPYVASLYNVGTGNADATFQNPWGVGLPPASAFPIWSPRTPDAQGYLQNIEKNWTSPITQQWNLNVQYGLPSNLLWEAGYVGTRGQHLATFRLPNQAVLASERAMPINGETTNTLENAYLRAPVLGFSPSGIWQVETEGNSFYNGLQTSLTQRLSHGVQFKVAYTFSKTLDDVPTSSPNLFVSSTGYTAVWGGLLIADQNSRRTSWGPADFDRTHRFVFSYQWQLPTLHTLPATVRAVTNGWQLAGVTTIQSGNALSVYDVNSGTIYGMYYGPAQLEGSHPAVATKGSTTSRLNNWINANAFSDPNAITDGFDFGNSGRGLVRGPGQDTRTSRCYAVSRCICTAMARRLSSVPKLSIFSITRSSAIHLRRWVWGSGRLPARPSCPACCNWPPKSTSKLVKRSDTFTDTAPLTPALERRLCVRSFSAPSLVAVSPPSQMDSRHTNEFKKRAFAPTSIFLPLKTWPAAKPQAMKRASPATTSPRNSCGSV